MRYPARVANARVTIKGILVVLKTLPIQSALSIRFVPRIRLAASINSKAASERMKGA